MHLNASYVNCQTFVRLRKVCVLEKKLNYLYMSNIDYANWTYSNHTDIRHCLLYVNYVFFVGFGKSKTQIRLKSFKQI